MQNTQLPELNVLIDKYAQDIWTKIKSSVKMSNNPYEVLAMEKQWTSSIGKMFRYKIHRALINNGEFPDLGLLMTETSELEQVLKGFDTQEKNDEKDQRQMLAANLSMFEEFLKQNGDGDEAVQEFVKECEQKKITKKDGDGTKEFDEIWQQVEMECLQGLRK